MRANGGGGGSKYKKARPEVKKETKNNGNVASQRNDRGFDQYHNPFWGQDGTHQKQKKQKGRVGERNPMEPVAGLGKLGLIPLKELEHCGAANGQG